MKILFAVLTLCSSILRFRCDGQPCTTQDASMLNATKSVLTEFAEIPETDKIRRGEVVFNRERAKFNVSEDYGFWFDEPQFLLKRLIEGWISNGFLGGSDARNVWRSFNRTLGGKGKGSFFGETSNPSFCIWSSYHFVSARTADDRVSAAYTFLILKDKDCRVSTTNPESDDLRQFVGYKNRKNFNKELTDVLAGFSTKYDRCRSMIQAA